MFILIMPVSLLKEEHELRWSWNTGSPIVYRVLMLLSSFGLLHLAISKTNTL